MGGGGEAEFSWIMFEFFFIYILAQNKTNVACFNTEKNLTQSLLTSILIHILLPSLIWTAFLFCSFNIDIQKEEYSGPDKKNKGKTMHLLKKEANISSIVGAAGVKVERVWVQHDSVKMCYQSIIITSARPLYHHRVLFPCFLSVMSWRM